MCVYAAFGKKPELWLTLIECYGLIKYTAILRSNKKNCQDNFLSITRIFSYIFQIFPFYIYFSEIWDMLTWDMWTACLKTFRSNRICKKSAYFLRNSQTSRENNSGILRIKDAKLSGYCFYMSADMKGDFQSALVYR